MEWQALGAMYGPEGATFGVMKYTGAVVSGLIVHGNTVTHKTVQRTFFSKW
jgi:hypothetical protein